MTTLLPGPQASLYGPGAPLIEVEGLSKTYASSRWPRKPLRTVAIDEVSLEVFAGESLGIAGESGSGKSTLISAICGLTRPDQGSVRLHGKDVWNRGTFDRSGWRSIQLVFQDPYTSLHPSMTLVESVAEPARYWQGLNRNDALAKARDLLVQVGLGGALQDRRPGSLSGGQLQRASIARALAADPEVILLDESVSALDVSIQAQILALMIELRRERNLTYVLVSHDISVLRLFCDRVLVMQHGRVVEECLAADLTLDGVSDPYTRRLLEAVPTVEASP